MTAKKENPKSAGRRTRYIPETVDAIVKTLEETGSDSIAYKTNSISPQTFYLWLTKHPEFSQKIEKARQTFKQSKVDYSKEDVNLAKAYRTRVLKGEQYKITRRETLTHTGDIVLLITEEQVLPTPQLIESVLGKAPINNEDISFTVNFGLAKPENV